MVKKRINFNRDYGEDVLGIVEDLSGDDPLRDVINRYSPIQIVEAPKGLVPIGDQGLYATPDEPADPTDCDRYPSSPWCGENPFTKEFISLEPSIILDECNIGIQFDGSFGFIKVPPASIVYRRKECRDKELEGKEITDQKLPDNLDNYLQPLNFKKLSCSEGVAGTICSHQESYSESYYLDYPSYLSVYRVLYRRVFYSKITREILEINFPYKTRYLHNENNEFVYLHLKVKSTRTYIENQDIPGLTAPSPAIRGIPRSTTGSQIDDVWLKKFNDGGGYAAVTTSLEGDGRLFSNIQRGINHIQSKTNFQRNNAIPSVTYNNVRYYDRSYLKETSIPLQLCEHPIVVFPPPPPLLQKKEKMACCPEQTALLLALIKRVDRLSQIVGVEDYPASLPASLISRDEGFLGNLIPNPNQEIPSLTQFLLWYVQRFDEIMGQWEIPIEIKDSDPSKPGDQPLGVKLPNMAEAIGEMFTLAFQTNINTETLLNFAVRSAFEGVTDKQQNFISYKLLQSLTEWAGYKQKDIKVKMPLLFSLNKTRYDEILQESEIDVAVPDFDEKFGLEADLIRFREAASILAANYKRKVNPNGDIKGQILKHLLDAYAAVSKVNKDEDDQDWDEFVKQVEDGFKNVPGVTNPDKPYGRDYSQRPKIRDLSKNDPPTEQP